MKTLVKITVAASIAGVVVWSIPPARKFIKAKKDEFMDQFHKTEDDIRRQLLTDPPLDQTEEFDGDF